MLEMLLNPKRAERRPWELFFIGFVYAGVSLFLANWLFLNNPVFSKYISMLVITFTVMFSIPFFYFLIKLEEERKVNKKDQNKLWKRHGKAISALMWLFLGFVVSYSLGYILFPEYISYTFQAQIEQYCNINMPSAVTECVSKHGGAVTGNFNYVGTGYATLQQYATNIFVNNLYVMIFSILFSLIFGAGAIFILAWNASVIATAVGIFASASLASLPRALSRYMIHGIPEIAAYFTAALAGGIISIALIRHEWNSEEFWDTIGDSLNLILLSVGFLVIGMLIEVFVTPKIFS